MTHFARPRFRSVSAGRMLGACAASLVLAACATSGKDLNAGDSARYRDEIGVYPGAGEDPSGMDAVAAAAFWGAKYERDKSDWRAAANYSAALRKLGSLDQAVRVIVSVADRHGDKPDVAFEAGKALIEAGRAFEAIRHLENADRERPDDWRILSSFGVALDQIGEHDLARAKYQYALTLSPNSVSIMNNKGLSFAMSGNLGEAARILRGAAARPSADARVRQNLALVLAIKGEMREAERLARSDLPPQIANGNIDYFRSIVAQPSYWTDFSPENVDAPDFGEVADASDDSFVPDFDAAPAKLTASPPKTPASADKTQTAETSRAPETAPAAPSEKAPPPLAQPASAPEAGEAEPADAPATATSATPTSAVAPAPNFREDANAEEVGDEDASALAPDLKAQY